MSGSILLDTCAAIWISQGDPIDDEAGVIIADLDRAGGVIAVSPITAWEVGTLVSRGRLALSREPTAWFQALIEAGVELASMAPPILIASSFLPGVAPRDPADRILAATARIMNYRLITRDKGLLDYAAAGHLDALAC
ncbi:MAG TPA: type II toxin-antitoxin system VapC family toxin [Caulobacteraceae bacterium]